MDDVTFNNNHQFYSVDLLEDSDEFKAAPDSPPPPPPPLPPNSTAAKKGRRGMKKKVVSVRINGDGPRNSSGSTTPPSDSWAWRKAYYRCSSSKGCPARKQVERNRLDPTMLLITYSCEHNHSGPVSRNNNHHQAAAVKPTSPETVPVHPEPEAEEKFVESLEDQFSWFGEMETTSSTVLESSIFSGRSSSGVGDSISSDVAMPFPMGDDDVDDSLFADLGELPECSVVFRHGGGPELPVDEQPATSQRRITPWCGATT
ncbi:probable WRKY transcription factor 65 isoform X3 [Cucurbita moschata]|uniref:Probable WRKY transcription factor 65 isoform X3 n=1 Tax=Cucurbita moschata TaxID=3662 RepID=A0A6J1EK89_CUCMO|nr:probable WRKY transcription factor 65 isoform X3 [Cucurbita moschata]